MDILVTYKMLQQLSEHHPHVFSRLNKCAMKYFLDRVYFSLTLTFLSIVHFKMISPETLNSEPNNIQAFWEVLYFKLG